MITEDMIIESIQNETNLQTIELYHTVILLMKSKLTNDVDSVRDIYASIQDRELDILKAQADEAFG